MGGLRGRVGESNGTREGQGGGAGCRMGGLYGPPQGLFKAVLTVGRSGERVQGGGGVEWAQKRRGRGEQGVDPEHAILFLPGINHMPIQALLDAVLKRMGV